MDWNSLLPGLLGGGGGAAVIAAISLAMKRLRDANRQDQGSCIEALEKAMAVLTDALTREDQRRGRIEAIEKILALEQQARSDCQRRLEVLEREVLERLVQVRNGA